jgi:hypothetical protein
VSSRREIPRGAACDLKGLGAWREFSCEEGCVYGVYAEIFEITGGIKLKSIDETWIFEILLSNGVQTG